MLSAGLLALEQGDRPFQVLVTAGFDCRERASDRICIHPLPTLRSTCGWKHGGRCLFFAVSDHELLIAIALQRAQQVLQPPSTVQLQLVGGTLVVTGTAGARWIEPASWLADASVGIDRVGTSGCRPQ